MNSFGLREAGVFEIEPPTDENERIHDNPHYSDSYYNEARTIFGTKEEGLSYVYSDRLEQWDYKKSNAARNVANENPDARPSTAKWYKIYLSEYFDFEVELPHIMAGCNLSTGYPYLVFGYRRK